MSLCVIGNTSYTYIIYIISPEEDSACSSSKWKTQFVVVRSVPDPRAEL